MAVYMWDHCLQAFVLRLAGAEISILPIHSTGIGSWEFDSRSLGSQQGFELTTCSEKLADHMGQDTYVCWSVWSFIR